MSDTYRELHITFAPEHLIRDDTEKVSHREFLVTRGIPANFKLYNMRRFQTITVELEEPLNDTAKAYLEYLKDIAVIDEWTEQERAIEEE